MSDATGNGWDEYRQLVLQEISRLASEIRVERSNVEAVQHRMLERMLDMDKQLAALKVRCGLAGLLAGAIPVTAALITKQL
tara:strand:+ start:567 stop:809 length:243 start_codon:yes stop_codon:yes gene_type:complete